MATSIENDRWFKLKVDNWLSSINHAAYTRQYPPTYVKPWYEHNFYWPQVAPKLAEGTKYTAEEVEEHLKHRIAMAKMEVLLDGE